MNIAPVSMAGINGISGVKECNGTKKVSELGLMNAKMANDSVSFKGRSAEMSDIEKKELIVKARTTATGYSVFFDIFSAAYYGLRSNNTVAKKYDLDPIEDKDLVKKIKKEQFIWTIPSIVLPIVGPIGAYIYNKAVVDPKDIDL